MQHLLRRRVLLGTPPQSPAHDRSKDLRLCAVLYAGVTTAVFPLFFIGEYESVLARRVHKESGRRLVWLRDRPRCGSQAEDQTEDGNQIQGEAAPGKNEEMLGPKHQNNDQTEFHSVKLPPMKKNYQTRHHGSKERNLHQDEQQSLLPILRAYPKVPKIFHFHAENLARILPEPFQINGAVGLFTGVFPFSTAHVFRVVRTDPIGDEHLALLFDEVIQRHSFRTIEPPLFGKVIIEHILHIELPKHALHRNQ